MAYNEDSESGREQVSWNIAGYQARHISDLLTKATSYYLIGNIGKWYWTLTALREMINYDLSTEEKEKLDALEKQAARLHASYDRYQKISSEGHPAPKELVKDKIEFSALIRIYQREVMDLLKELGYFPKKEDRTDLGF